MYQIKIDLDKCQGCGECVDICPMEVLALENEKAMAAHPEECAGCLSCVETCPEGAIEVIES